MRGDEAIFDSISFPYQRFGSQDSEGFDFYRTRTTVSYELDRFSFVFGKSVNEWGHGTYGNLLLSDLALPYTQLRMQARFAPFTVTTLQTKLVQDPPIEIGLDSLYDNTARRHFADKWMAAHRIQIDLGRTLQVSVSEMVIYGERGFEVQYLHPLIFIRWEEHYLRDRDNVLIGADVRWVLFQRLILHGDLLLDDLSWSDFGTSRYSNKNAILLSATLIDPLLPNSSATLEYARFSPYVYTHKFPVNVAQHYGVNLGYHGKPNSDHLTAGLRWTPDHWITLDGVLKRIRHGQNTREGKNVGGDVRQPYRDNGEAYVDFLDGDLATIHGVELGGSVEPIYNLHVKVSFGRYNRSIQYETGGTDKDSWNTYQIGLAWHPLF